VSEQQRTFDFFLTALVMLVVVGLTWTCMWGTVWHWIPILGGFAMAVYFVNLMDKGAGGR
jgi:hypothetical protein